jgi:hypothetical protein
VDSDNTYQNGSTAEPYQNTAYQNTPTSDNYQNSAPINQNANPQNGSVPGGFVPIDDGTTAPDNPPSSQFKGHFRDFVDEKVVVIKSVLQGDLQTFLYVSCKKSTSVWLNILNSGGALVLSLLVYAFILELRMYGGTQSFWDSLYGSSGQLPVIPPENLFGFLIASAILFYLIFFLESLFLMAVPNIGRSSKVIPLKTALRINSESYIPYAAFVLICAVIAIFDPTISTILMMIGTLYSGFHLFFIFSVITEACPRKRSYAMPYFLMQLCFGVVCVVCLLAIFLVALVAVTPGMLQ